MILAVEGRGARLQQEQAGRMEPCIQGRGKHKQSPGRKGVGAFQKLKVIQSAGG